MASLLRRAESLVGLPYVEGQFDCGHLAVLAARELFGREVQLPVAQPHPCAARDQAAALAVCRRELARKVAEPQPGDLALFIEDLGIGAHQWHVGTLVAWQPEPWVLHTYAGAASVLQRLADCRRCGLVLEGWYRWT